MGGFYAPNIYLFECSGGPINANQESKHKKLLWVPQGNKSFSRIPLFAARHPMLAGTTRIQKVLNDSSINLKKRVSILILYMKAKLTFRLVMKPFVNTWESHWHIYRWLRTSTQWDSTAYKPDHRRHIILAQSKPQLLPSFFPSDSASV